MLAYRKQFLTRPSVCRSHLVLAGVLRQESMAFFWMAEMWLKLEILFDNVKSLPGKTRCKVLLPFFARYGMILTRYPCARVQKHRRVSRTFCWSDRRAGNLRCSSLWFFLPNRGSPKNDVLGGFWYQTKKVTVLSLHKSKLFNVNYVTSAFESSVRILNLM